MAILSSGVEVAIQPLESELFSLLGRDDKARIAARYCGFDGLGGATLHVVGAEFGITAERVRQIVGEVVRRRGSASSAAPALEKAVAFIASHVPGFADDIERKLQSTGLSGRPFRIEGIIRAAELFARPVPFSLTETQKFRLVHSLAPQALDAIIRVARRAIERRGLATLDTVSGELREVAPGAAGSRLIADLLDGAGNLRWLDQSAGWFWLPDVPRNPVVRRIRKILSVANPVRLGDLCAGVARESGLQSDAPPAAVLLELCRQTPGVMVAGECIQAEPAINPSEVLGELEQAIVGVLVEHGGVMRRADLAVVCRERGLNRSSFYSALAHSPVIAAHPGGLLSVIGTEIAPGPVPGLDIKPRSKYLHSKGAAHAISFRKLMQ